MLKSGHVFRPGIPGVYVDSDAQWHLADIPVPLKMAGDSFAELRLTITGRTTAGLRYTETPVCDHSV